MNWIVRSTARAIGVCALVAIASGTTYAGADVPERGVCRATANDYYMITLTPTSSSGNASGTARVSFVDSPFGLAMTTDGFYSVDVELETRGLSPLPSGQSYIVWATAPSLSPIMKLGKLGSDGKFSTRVELNKFILLVTAEANTATGEKWAGPIALRGLSRSGLMHSFMGHGPLEGPC